MSARLESSRHPSAPYGKGVPDDSEPRERLYPRHHVPDHSPCLRTTRSNAPRKTSMQRAKIGSSETRARMHAAERVDTATERI
jgi:hypothetical protein